MSIRANLYHCDPAYGYWRPYILEAAVRGSVQDRATVSPGETEISSRTQVLNLSDGRPFSSWTYSVYSSQGQGRALNSFRLNHGEVLN